MKLITEVYDDGCSVLTEASEDGKKGYFIEGIFMQGDVKNRNGRIYPSNILENEMKRYNDQFIKTKRALGELGHPNGPQINGDRVSHLITEMKRDGSNFVGKAKILSTPMGEIVKTFIDEGVKVGVSTRGLGSVKPTKEGIMEVQDDFHLATVDIVTDPSGPNCFVNGIMENTEYYYDITSGNWRIMEKLEETVKELKKEVTVRNPIGEAKALRIFENFIASLK
jgi:sugar-specific transcriptional regulator TrmB